MSFQHLLPRFQTFLTQISSHEVPCTVQEAIMFELWRKGMDEEMRALEKNQTWDIVELPKGKKTVGCKWIFNVKYKANGTLERYKARLVAKEYTRTYDIDY